MKKVLIILMLILINNAALAQNIENEEYTAEIQKGNIKIGQF